MCVCLYVVYSSIVIKDVLYVNKGRKKENKTQITEMTLKVDMIINTDYHLKHIINRLLSHQEQKPWVCEVVQKRGRAGLEGRAWKCEMEPGGHLWGRSWPWTACWPGGPGAAAPPPLASGGAAPLQPDLHQLPPHTAYREKRRGGLVSQYKC